MLSGVVLVLALASDPLSPTLAVDLDGDGSVETVTAAPARAAVRLEVRNAGGQKLATASAPAPSADVVHVRLSAGVLGSTGALVGVLASTDAAECASVWRWKDGALTRIPLRDSGGKELPDCGRLDEWAWSWQRAGDTQPSMLVRQRTEKVESGTFRVQEVFRFAGFSLDADPRESGAEINGVPIPAWYPATFYTRAALEVLYERFDLSRMRGQTTLRIDADRQRGVFALRFAGPDADRTVPIEASETKKDKTILTATADGKTVHATVSRGGDDGSVPFEIEVEGLGAPFDQIYAPAGGWRSAERNIFLSAVDEVVSKNVAGTWADPANQNLAIATEGAPPYQVRVDKDLYTPILEGAPAPLDLLLLPAGSSGRPWGLILRGPNVLDRVPVTCDGPGAAGCRADGPRLKLKRLGGRMNAR